MSAGSVRRSGPEVTEGTKYTLWTSPSTPTSSSESTGFPRAKLLAAVRRSKEYRPEDYQKLFVQFLSTMSLEALSRPVGK